MGLIVLPLNLSQMVAVVVEAPLHFRQVAPVAPAVVVLGLGHRRSRAVLALKVRETMEVAGRHLPRRAAAGQALLVWTLRAA